MDLSKVGKYISKKRVEKGYTQRQLGDLLGVTEKTISKWECGVNAPDISLLLNLSNILSTSTQEILLGESKLDDKNQKKINKPNLLISFVIVILFIVSILGITFFINNYDKYRVYSVESNSENIVVEGIFLTIGERDILDINNIAYFDETIGTADELFFKNIDVSIFDKNDVIYSTGIFYEGNEGVSISKALEILNLYIDENTQGNIFKMKSIETDSIYLKLSYTTIENKNGYITIPLSMKKEFSNQFFL